MNLLITGGCGHIGSYIIEHINKIKKIKKTIVIDNLMTTQLNSLFNSKKKNNLKFYIRDLTKEDSLKDIKKYVKVCNTLQMYENVSKSMNKCVIYGIFFLQRYTTARKNIIFFNVFTFILKPVISQIFFFG